MTVTPQPEMTEAQWEEFKLDLEAKLGLVYPCTSIEVLCHVAQKIGEVKGFTDYDLAAYCTLTTGELTEMYEHYCRGELEAPSEKIPEFTNEEEEAADVVLRTFNRMGARGLGDRFLKCLVAKCKYNLNRKYRWKLK